MSQRVVILGASDRPDRYAHRAFQNLREHGHEVVPVHPTLPEVEGVAVLPDLDSVEGPVDTLTLYVNSKISEALVDPIVRLAPKRVIFNPGTESDALADALEDAGIEAVDGCTLVMLSTGTFE